MMIDAELLKVYIAAIDQALKDWESVGAAYDASPADKQCEFSKKFTRAEHAYYRACEELASVVRSQVTDADRAPRPLANDA